MKKKLFEDLYEMRDTLMMKKTFIPLAKVIENEEKQQNKEETKLTKGERK